MSSVSLGSYTPKLFWKTIGALLLLKLAHLVVLHTEKLSLLNLSALPRRSRGSQFE